MVEGGFLAVAGLIAAVAITAGLWEWRRRSRTSGLKTEQRTAAATLPVSAPEVTCSDRDVGSRSLRPGLSVETAPDSLAGATATISAGLALAGTAAADPSEALGEDEAPTLSDTPEAASQPSGFSLPVHAPSPPPAEDEARLIQPHHGDESNGPGPMVRPADSGPTILKTAEEAAAGGTVAQGARVTTHRDSAGPLPPLFSTRDAPGDADPGDADGPDDARQEGIDEQPAAEAAATGATGRQQSGTTQLRPPPDAPSDPIPANAESLNDRPKEGIEDRCDADQQALPCTETDAVSAGLFSSSADEAEPEDTVEMEPEPTPDPALPSAPETPARAAIRPRQPAIHRDRRGKRRAATDAAPSQSVRPALGPTARPPAEAKLRLSLHPIRRTARLSVVPTRPDGFPARVTVLEAGGHAVEAYDEQRYDDLDLPWTSEFLEGELRLTSADGFQWLRSARQVHIFAQDPNEPELISTSAARAGIAHTLICRSDDAETLRVAAVATGSPELQTYDHWQGIPDGWVVLSGYAPVHAAASPLPPGFRTMDPGEGLEISFEGGLPVRGRVYAAGHPPRIVITPAPGAASVTIGGLPAELSSEGAWTAPGWDMPGQHMVDIVPGPSVSYEIAADPWLSGGWEFWDAQPKRFGDGVDAPWARARICGALIRGPADETVLAAESQPTLVALGAKAGTTPLRRRVDAAVCVAIIAEPPAFLLSATGPRRSQGRVIWLGFTSALNPSRRHDADWVAIVRSAAARRLPLVQADALGEDAWRKAKERARRLRSRRPRR